MNQLLLSECAFFTLREPLAFGPQLAPNLHHGESISHTAWEHAAGLEPFLGVLLLKTAVQCGFCRGWSPVVHAGPQQLLWCEQDAPQAREPSQQPPLHTATSEACRSTAVCHEVTDTSKGTRTHLNTWTGNCHEPIKVQS